MWSRGCVLEYTKECVRICQVVFSGWRRTFQSKVETYFRISSSTRSLIYDIIIYFFLYLLNLITIGWAFYGNAENQLDQWLQSL